MPSQEAVTIALRTQQIIAHESGAADTIDALAGAYCIESLTNQIEEEANRYIEKIDSLGGAVSAIEKGYMQREIVESAYRHQRQIEKKERVIIGVNQFAAEEEVPIKILRVNPAVERKQNLKLQRLKRRRNGRRVKEVLSRLETAALKNENIMPIVIEAVKDYATLGEICDVLRQVYGEHKASTIF